MTAPPGSPEWRPSWAVVGRQFGFYRLTVDEAQEWGRRRPRVAPVRDDVEPARHWLDWARRRAAERS